MLKRLICAALAAALMLCAVPAEGWYFDAPGNFYPDGPVLEYSLEPSMDPRVIPALSESDLLAPMAIDYSSFPTFSTVEEAGRYWGDCVRDRKASFGVLITSHGEHENEVDWEKIANEYYTDIIYEGLKHTGEPDKGDYLRQIGGTYGGTLSYLVRSGTEGRREITKYIISYEPGYYYSTAEEEAQVGPLVDQLIDELGVRSDRISDYDKIAAVYGWITENIRYDYDTLNDDSYHTKHSAYAGIKNRTCVCSGYALLFYRIMLTLGIDCRYITGYTTGGYHAWNIVNLYGEYFLLDSTWDEGCETYSWFLLGTSSRFKERKNDSQFDADDFKAAYNIPPCAYATHEAARLGPIAPSCVAEGSTGSGLCPECSVWLTAYSVPALGHDFSDGVCTRCKRVRPARGDLTEDGGVDVMDGVIMQRILSGIEGGIELCDFADLNLDGQADVMDGVIMQRMLAGLDT